MTRRRLSTCAMALVVAAACCQPGPDTGSISPSATSPGATPATTASSNEPEATDAATPIPELLRLTLDDSGPIITIDDGPTGSRYDLPAAGARARDGTYVLVIVWFGAGDEPPVITVATSPNTHDWTVGSKPILTDLGVGGTDPGPIPAALVELDDGTWLMYGWAADPTRESSFASWRASAPKVDGPWTLDRDRVIAQGSGGTWDSQTASIGSVQRTESGFAAWYEGQPPGSNLRGDLGFATSADGLRWQKFDDPTTISTELAESDPVVRRGICGVGTSKAVFQPQVEVVPDGFAMVFGGFGASGDRMDVFGAMSADGVRWSCGTPQALLRAGGIPNSQGIHSLASFPLGDGRIGLVIESLGEGRSDIWFATVTPIS